MRYALKLTAEPFRYRFEDRSVVGPENQDELAPEADLGLGEAPFGGELEGGGEGAGVSAFASTLAAEWSRRRNGSPSAGAIASWLVADHRDTLEGARRRWGKNVGAPPFTVEAITRAWQISRQENMLFQLGSRRVQLLGRFAAPAERVALVSSALIEDSTKAPVAPLTVAFAKALRLRWREYVRLSNYRGHGGGSFLDRGYSLDLFLRGQDARGFYRREDAVRFLRAVHESANSAGAEWRVLYNDFAVADAANRALGRAHVVFVGKASKDLRTKRVTGLIWHGPAPLILHFHLDLMPRPGGSASSWRGAATGAVAKPPTESNPLCTGARVRR